MWEIIFCVWVEGVGWGEFNDVCCFVFLLLWDVRFGEVFRMCFFEIFIIYYIINCYVKCKLGYFIEDEFCYYV